MHLLTFFCIFAAKITRYINMAEGFNDNYRKRPEILECDVVRFQNAKDKWVAFVGLLD